jgi:hypothetical protein
MKAAAAENLRWLLHPEEMQHKKKGALGKRPGYSLEKV